MGNNIFFSAVSLEYAELFWLKFLQNIQHLACRVSDPTVKFWQEIIKHINIWSIRQPWQHGSLALCTQISQKEERCEVAHCHKTEPDGSTEQRLTADRYRTDSLAEGLCLDEETEITFLISMLGVMMYKHVTINYAVTEEIKCTAKRIKNS